MREEGHSWGGVETRVVRYQSRERLDAHAPRMGAEGWVLARVAERAGGIVEARYDRVIDKPSGATANRRP